MAVMMEIFKRLFTGSVLQNYGTDMTLMAERGELEEVIGREKEMEQLIQALLKQGKSNPCLVGNDAGVGKVIVEGLAIKIAQGSVPDELRGKRIFSIDMNRLVAGTIKREEFEKRMKGVLEEVERSEGRVILFIDELHTIIRTGGGLDDASIIKPALSRGDFMCIGATTMEEYTRYIEGDAALNRRFESIHVCDETLCAFISGIVQRKLHLPAKAGATGSDFKNVVSTPMGIFVGVNTFKFSLIGQEEALVALSGGALLRAHTGVKDETKPFGSFLFTGPTGLGKKEMAKLYAEVYFGCEEAMVRLDMGEYMEQHSVSRLIGSPHEDNDGQLTEAVRRRPHCLVLFSEMEKAHQQVWDVVLEILDEGRLTDGKGKTVDFSNTIVILTLNMEREKKFRDAFKPELIKRFHQLREFDQCLMFKPFSKKDTLMILEFLIREEFAKVAANKNIKVRVSKGLKERLVSEGCDKRYGAWDLQRAMARLVEDKLAQEILSGIVAEQYSIIIKLAGETVAEQDCEAVVEIGLGMSKTDLMAEQDCEAVVEIRLGVNKSETD